METFLIVLSSYLICTIPAVIFFNKKEPKYVSYEKTKGGKKYRTYMEVNDYSPEVIKKEYHTFIKYLMVEDWYEDFIKDAGKPPHIVYDFTVELFIAGRPELNGYKSKKITFWKER